MRGQEQEKVIHGGRVRRLFEQCREPIFDFSANLNPFPPDIGWDPDAVSLDAYPDDEYHALKEQIARIFHRDPGEIAVGNGSIELIRVFCQAVLRQGDLYLAETPTFGEYAYSASLAGARAAEPGNTPAVTFICNPNNPDGRLLKRSEVSAILNKSRSDQGLLFLDEAFIELADAGESLVSQKDPGLFLIRSLTKSFAVPGIRFGYGFGEPDLVSRMEAMRPPWSVNAYAEQFAILAFAHYDLLAGSCARIAEEREWLYRSLSGLGLHPQPSSANFILVHTGQPAAELCTMLERFRVLARDCTSFGLPLSIRVAVRTRDENRILVEALAACLH